MHTDTLSIDAGAASAASADGAPAPAFRHARWLATGATLFAVAAVLLASAVAVVMSLS